MRKWQESVPHFLNEKQECLFIYDGAKPVLPSLWDLMRICRSALKFVCTRMTVDSRLVLKLEIVVISV